MNKAEQITIRVAAMMLNGTMDNKESKAELAEMLAVYYREKSAFCEHLKLDFCAADDIKRAAQFEEMAKAK